MYPEKIVIVAGMHRSGTSLATHLISVLGAEIGESLLAPMANVNDDGFWENRKIVELHEKMLERVGSAWYDTRLLPGDFPNTEDSEYFAGQIETIFEQEYADKNFICIKDPRICRLLPLWQEACSRTQVHVALIFRNPAEIAESLKKRDEFPPSLSYWLWCLYVLESERNTRNYLRSAHVFDEIIEDPATLLDPLSRALQVDAAFDRAYNLVRPELRHFKDASTLSFDADVVTPDRLEQFAQCIYQKILESPGHFPSCDFMDRAYQQLTTLSSAHDWCFDLENKLLDLVVRRGREISRIGRLHYQTQRTLEDRECKIKQIATTAKLLEKKQAASESLLNRIIDNFPEISEANRRNAELDVHDAVTTEQVVDTIEWMREQFIALNDYHKRIQSGWIRHVLPPPPSVAQHSSIVDVIVPIYKGSKQLKTCIRSLLNSAQEVRFEMILINDASPEPEILDCLDAIEDPRVHVLVNERNLGFVATVNRGIELHPKRDVVLLNSDTQVANNWLDRLRACAKRQANIATATPFSNNATICSFPSFCQDNRLIPGEETQSLDRVFAAVNAREAVEIPTAVGFCMYIRRACIDEIGAFDVESFGRGYGEENDFCRRAVKNGWINVLCADTFVFHEGGVSFENQKNARLEVALNKVNELHPGYAQAVSAHIAEDPAALLRQRALLALARMSPRPRVLMLTHHLQGGTKKHVEELIDYMSEKICPIILHPIEAGEGVYALKLDTGEAGGYFTFRLPGEQDLLLSLLRWIRIHRIHVHHIMGLHPSVLALIRQLGVEYDVTLHDYYYINANPSLTNNQGVFCSKQETRDSCCRTHYSIPGGLSPEKWRQQSEDLLRNAQRILSPSTYTANVYRQHFSLDNMVTALHHDWEQDAPYPPVKFIGKAKQEPLRIAVLGALSKEKGADILEECAILAKKRGYPLSFTLVGFAYRALHPAVHQTGPYQDTELSKLIPEHGPHVIWFPATWPETYSYTLSTTLKLGIPCAVPDIGAFPERVRSRPFTWINPHLCPSEDWLGFFLKIASDLPENERIAAWDQQPNGSQFLYHRDYAPEPLAIDEIGELNWQEWFDTTLASHWTMALPPGAKAFTLAEKALVTIVDWARRSEYLSRLMRAVPGPWQLTIKSLFTQRPMQDLDRLKRFGLTKGNDG